MREQFNKLEAAAERGIVEAQVASEWISGTIAAAFELRLTMAHSLPELPALNGADACERVAESLALWLKESAPARFESMCGAAYSVNSLETCADGFERLRYQREFILLAYPGRDSTPAEIAEQWADDISACGRPDGFAYALARRTVAEWAADNESRLAAELAALEWPDDQDDDSDVDSAPVFRLYVADDSESAE